MPVVYIEGVVAGADGEQATVRFLVDSDATYTLLPYEDWRALALRPKRSATFALADGTTIGRSPSTSHPGLRSASAE